MQLKRCADGNVKRVRREACSRGLELELASKNCGVQEGVDKEERRSAAKAGAWYEVRGTW